MGYPAWSAVAAPDRPTRHATVAATPASRTEATAPAHAPSATATAAMPT